MRFGSLFSGIGGLDLGLERAGHQVAWQVEIDPFCRRVLAKHWPGVPCYEDVKNVGAHNLAPIDLICGGFPCQDISFAGKGGGLSGARSGLWVEFARIIRELEPRYILVENVAALLSRGMGEILGTLASFGYDAEWSVVSACSLGAPHSRERLFLLAYATSERCPSAIRGHFGAEAAVWPEEGEWGEDITELPNRVQVATPARGEGGGAWLRERGVLGMVDGLPEELDAIRTLGNAVVPQVAELIGRRLPL